MLQGKAPLAQTTDPGDLHQQIQMMIAAARGAPAPAPQAPMPPQGMAPQGMPAPPMQGPPQGPAPAAVPQMGGSPQNAQRAMMAQAIRG